MFRAVCSVASGEVVDMIEVECDEKPNTWAPRIGFVDQNGRYVEFQTTSSCYPPEYRVRQKVRVFYLPGQSETPLVETEARNFHSWMTIAAAAVGTAVIGAGAFFHLGR